MEPPLHSGVQHGKAAELSTACAARGRGAPRAGRGGGGRWLGRGLKLERNGDETAVCRRRNACLVDNDRSGHLDAAEVKELARKLKLDLSDEDAKVAMEKMDADCNGTVDFDEFF